MITRLTLCNFKSIGEQTYDFRGFSLLVGRNNSGKSTVLQALAIWQFCVDEFKQSKRKGSKGILVVLPNFTALPVPEFNLLWKDKLDRTYPPHPSEKDKKIQTYILISITVEWQRAPGATHSFGVQLRYQSPQTIYAMPIGGWAAFRTCEAQGDLPKIAYVPPFSGLEPAEKWVDLGPLRQQVGKGQPGSVLRNLLLRVCPSPLPPSDPPKDWKELAGVIQRWFTVEIQRPKYESDKHVYITVEYRQENRHYDIISGGSGFHQVLTLLAFLYGYQPTTILLDEPDAHLHVNLQREVLDYFKQKSAERNTQFLIATHAEEFVSGVDPSQIISLLSQVPTTIQSTPDVLRAMADVSNGEVTQLMVSPYILYLEGENDGRLLRAWANVLKAAINKVYFKHMGGGSKKEMKERADQHFNALSQIVPGVSRLMLFDYDDTTSAYHPAPDNMVLAEWKRKNIENYLLVPDAWKRAVLKQMQYGEENLFTVPALDVIDRFFAGENLTLPPGQNWRNVTANVFGVVDGKKILFEKAESLFQQLRNAPFPIQILREEVAMNMNEDEIHEDVRQFFDKLSRMLETNDNASPNDGADPAGKAEDEA